MCLLGVMGEKAGRSFRIREMDGRGSQKTQCARLNPRTQESSQEAPGHLLDSSLGSVEENWEGRMTFAS